MSKNYDDVKRAAEANIRGLCRAIKSNLNQKEAEKLFIELSMSLFTASLNFDLPVEEFSTRLSHRLTGFMFQITEETAVIKRSVDKGEDYDGEEI